MYIYVNKKKYVAPCYSGFQGYETISLPRTLSFAAIISS